ncbi:MAG: PIN domain-containing protein [Actinomycetota bacterium]|nr:PIN domain-containing protein [Actinomycetota bacterium]
MRVVADSHAIVWFVAGSSRLSEPAREALRAAERERALTVSIATFLDLWYVTQTTQGVTAGELHRLEATLSASSAVDVHPIDEAVADAFATIDRSAVADPWDRLIMATAMTLNAPLITRDALIRQAGVVETIW